MFTGMRRCLAELKTLLKAQSQIRKGETPDSDMLIGCNSTFDVEQTDRLQPQVDFQSDDTIL